MTVLLRTIAVVGLGTGCLLPAVGQPASQIKDRLQVSNTEHFDLPPGGTLRLVNSTGEVTIEGWDQPGVEMTTLKWIKDPATGSDQGSRELAQVKIASDRKGSELDITTQFPHSRLLPPSFPIGGSTDVGLDYHIKVPRDTKVIVQHYIGEVNIEGVTSDVQAAARQGTIVLHLPENGQYTIAAKSDVGNVVSDFPGTSKRWRVFGKELTQASAAPHKLDLRDRYGDIIILTTDAPKSAALLNR